MTSRLMLVWVMVAGGPAFADDPAPPGPPPLPSTDPSAAEPVPAQPPPPPPPPLSLPAPVDGRFVLLDRQDGRALATAELAYMQLAQDDRSLRRIDVHAQYVDHFTGAGGYVHLPLGAMSGPDLLDSETRTRVGGLEVGGILSRPLSPVVAGVFHVGIVLPTADRDEEVNILAAISRPNDLYLGLHTTAFRAGFSPVVHSGIAFARADLGADKGLDDRNATETLVHFNAAVGVDTGRVVLAVELSNVRLGGPPPPDVTVTEDERWLDVWALSGRLRTRRFDPYLAIVLPRDADSKAVMTRAITLGLDAHL